jgi:hypothetical protein
MNIDLDKTVALRIGEQSPSFGTGTLFGEFITDLQIHQCCLGPA